MAILDATVIPMTERDDVLRNRTIVVTGTRISAIGPAATTLVPAGARRIDGRGTFVIRTPWSNPVNSVVERREGTPRSNSVNFVLERRVGNPVVGTP